MQSVNTLYEVFYVFLFKYIFMFISFSMFVYKACVFIVFGNFFSRMLCLETFLFTLNHRPPGTALLIPVLYLAESYEQLLIRIALQHCNHTGDQFQNAVVII